MILLFYIFLYCNADNILNKLYLSNYSTITNNELFQYNKNFYYSITNQNLFALSVYTIYVIKNCINYNPVNKVSIALAFVYIKYILNLLLSDNMTLSFFLFFCSIKWAF